MLYHYFSSKKTKKIKESLDMIRAHVSKANPEAQNLTALNLNYFHHKKKKKIFRCILFF